MNIHPTDYEPIMDRFEIRDVGDNILAYALQKVKGG